MTSYINSIMDLLPGETPKAKYDYLRTLINPDITKDDVIAIIEDKCPELANSCKVNKADSIIFHQLAFSEKELFMLGASVKYIGYKNKDVVIVKEKQL